MNKGVHLEVIVKVIVLPKSIITWLKKSSFKIIPKITITNLLFENKNKRIC